ncbi:asparagine synthase (glutamine-hydrolyzing) [Egicoccus sp. AB-alg2]|uniref:asparagine synthase (glutamine-hydrolyzing) n=1 Tax=Egicoccus sp. AB-alg2 TaxID=3242693 RepID=UPI00359DDCDE
MCGIAGQWDREQATEASALERTVSAMADVLWHRGPDDGGAWADERAGIALGFRRLAIIDLSEAGAQPMVSADGRYTIVYNGELYNHEELHAALGGVRLRGHSDTEILLEHVARWGIEKTLARANGMFALGLWDAQERVLRLARDRMGEKPLYYGFLGRTFVFASGLASLRVHPDFDLDVDRDALTAFLRYGFVPAPRSVWRGVHKLPPGCWLELHEGGVGPQVRAYWSAVEVARAARADPLDGSDRELADALEETLLRAVAIRRTADVPLGALLSGGVDSSLVVAMLQAQSSSPVRSFTIGFHDRSLDEAVFARDIARHLGTEHTELYVGGVEALAVVPQLPALYDEPMADSSQLPTHVVSRLARRHVTVCLGGDGGDELFGGYTRYLYRQGAVGKLHRLPSPLRRGLAAGLVRPPVDQWDRLFARLGPVLPRELRQSQPGWKVHKLGESLGHDDHDLAYRSLLTLWEQPEALVVGGREPPDALTAPPCGMAGMPPDDRMPLVDVLLYLPDDILAKVDRAAMGASLETRLPLLDPDVFELSWRIPPDARIRDGQTKWLLRQVLDRYVPRQLLDRPKKGFVVPVGEWLRGPLRDWGEALLDPRRVAEEGLLEPEPITRAWRRHQAGRGGDPRHLWAVLVFQQWLEAQRHPPVPARLGSPGGGQR